MPKQKSQFNKADIEVFEGLVTKVLKREVPDIVRMEVSIQLDAKLKEFSEEMDRKMLKQLSDFYNHIDPIIEDRILKFESSFAH